MTDHMILHGSDDVRHAASDIKQAAQTISGAFDMFQIQQIVQRLESCTNVMSDFIDRFEKSVDRMNEHMSAKNGVT